MATVAKNFKTTSRKFKEGQTVKADEVDNFEIWKARGFIREGAANPAPPTMAAPSPVDTPTAEAPKR